LIIIFTLFTLLATPSYIYYGAQNAYKDAEVSGNEIWSLGNLGYSSIQCVQRKLSTGIMSIQCPYGVVGEIIDYGVNPDKSHHDLCLNTSATDWCKPTFLPPNLKNVIGQSGGTMNFTSESLWTIPRMVDDSCTKASNFLFVQYTCVHDTESMHSRYQAVCTIVFLSILMAFIFLIWTRKSMKGQVIDLIKYDLNTITAADYTIHTKFDPKNYMDWYEKDYKLNGDEASGISPAISLKKKIVKDIEEIVKNETLRKVA